MSVGLELRYNIFTHKKKLYDHPVPRTTIKTANIIDGVAQRAAIDVGIRLRVSHRWSRVGCRGS
jgi:hypothetical protein